MPGKVRMPRRFVLRAGAIATASALVLVGAAGVASAHVTVSSPDAKPGGYAKLVFRVPTESDNTSTTKLVVSLPVDHPFAHVGAQVKDGWKVEKKEQKLPTPMKVGDLTLTRRSPRSPGPPPRAASRRTTSTSSPSRSANCPRVSTR